MARVLLLCALVLLATSAIADAHILQGFTTSAPKVSKKPASVKLVVHNVADRKVTFTCVELGKDAKPVTADKGEWTAIGPIDVTLDKNSILHLTVTVGTGKRYGFVKKSLMINLLKQFQYNLEGSKFLVLTAVENSQQRTLKLNLGKREVLTFNLY
ncbi:hypothetical protein M758_10G023400 [Ceratodon purpureus]|nr:hypothetical protein M758_10G023400 [Ceratodon purpureus]